MASAGNQPLIDVTYELNAEDFAAMAEARSSDRPGRRQAMLLWAFLTLNLVLGGWMLLDAWMSDMRPSRFAWLHFGVAALILLVRFVLVPRGLRWRFEQSRMGDSPTRLVVDRRGLRVEQSGLDTRFRWREIERAQRGERHYFFWLSPARAVIVPLRGLGDDQQRSALWELAVRETGKTR